MVIWACSTFRAPLAAEAASPVACRRKFQPRLDARLFLDTQL